MNLFISFALTSAILLLGLALACYFLLLMVAQYFIARQKRKNTQLPEKLRSGDLEFNSYVYTTSTPPMILLHEEEQPPGYTDIEANYSSPCPSYETVVYMDRIAAMFGSLYHH